jgi:hypothetical protein
VTITPRAALADDDCGDGKYLFCAKTLGNGIGHERAFCTHSTKTVNVQIYIK